MVSVEMAAISPKRIVLVGPMHPYRGGIAHFLETMYWGLQERGHAVSVVTFTRQYPKILFPGKTQFVRGKPDRLIPADRIVDSINPVTWYKAARHISKLKPDVVIFKYWMPFFAPAFGTIARRTARAGARVILVVDNAIPHERHPGDAQLGRFMLRAAHGCIVMSEAVSRDVEALNKHVPRRLVAHPLYDMFGEAMQAGDARKSLGLPPGDPVLLFFGFVRKYKGLHVLLDAMPSIVASLPNARLVVAGEWYDNEDSYRNQVIRNSLQDNVRFDAAYIPNEDVPRYFSAADVVVQPYVSATQSGVAQVAFNFDKPMIITDVGGLAEVVRHEEDGLVVPPDDPQALADAVVRFFGENMGDRFKEGVRMRKQEFGWSKLFEAVESLVCLRTAAIVARQ